MIAVNLDFGQVLVRETAVPARPPGFALIRMLVAGIATQTSICMAALMFFCVPGSGERPIPPRMQ